MTTAALRSGQDTCRGPIGTQHYRQAAGRWPQPGSKVGVNKPENVVSGLQKTQNSGYLRVLVGGTSGHLIQDFGRLHGKIWYQVSET